MYPTTEVRWLLPGDVPGNVKRWFDRIGDQDHHFESRVDRYLRLPLDDSMGIKLRERRVEIKIRNTTHGNVVLGTGAVGRMESWHKWSFQLAEDNDEAITADSADPSWVHVDKERMMKRFRVDDRGVIIPAPTGDVATGTCALELTRIGALDQLWWSLAFEANGKDAQSREGLVLIGRQLLATPHPFAFTANDSLSFPQWLSKILSADGILHANQYD